MNEERIREQQGLREGERGGEGEAHFLLRTQGRKFMNGSHLSSCSKCKQHTWTKKHKCCGGDGGLSETREKKVQHRRVQTVLIKNANNNFD